MKRILILSTALILSISILGCSNSTNQDIDKIDLYINMEEEFNNGKLNIKINSNLPDNTQGSITVANDSINYLAQSEVEFKDSEATSEEFSSKGNGLDKGTYEITFVAPLSAFQPEEIQEIIGEDYENIISEYIIESEFGTLIEYTKELIIK